jgi:uncharacterized membrane protein YGL010W
MNDLVFYQQYHQNPINKCIHFFCIPIISFCVINFLASVSVFLEHKRTSIYQGYWFRGDEIALVFYCCYYYLNYGIFVAVIMKTYLHGIIYLADMFRQKNQQWFYHNYIMFFVAWIFQFIGHYIEGQQPALMKGVTQSFLVAPLFVVQYIFPEFLQLYM